MTTPQIPSHQHKITKLTSGGQNPAPTRSFFPPAFESRRAEPVSPGFSNEAFPNTGGGGSHTHPFTGSLSSATTASSSFAVPSMDVKHANVIVAAKD